MTIIQRRRSSEYAMSPDERERLQAMTDDEVLAASENDPDALPLDSRQVEKLQAARIAQDARRRAGLSQAKFAQAYRIKVSRLRDMEQGRRQPDEAVVALLTLIADDPERAARVLRRAEQPDAVKGS